jgi:hypothetical protein
MIHPANVYFRFYVMAGLHRAIHDLSSANNHQHKDVDARHKFILGPGALGMIAE